MLSYPINIQLHQNGAYGSMHNAYCQIGPYK
jgi:hypothetical protein